MKQRAAVMTMAMVLVTVMTAAAQPGHFSTVEKHRATDLAKVVCSYTAALKTGNDGVIESALSHLVRMKLFVPEMQCPELRQEIARLAMNGATPTIRYKAYLTSLVFDAPQLFKAESARNYEGPEELFTSVASRLQIALIGNENSKYAR
jgi:hypothetical protein